jgi:hypothetical protein
MPKLRSQKDQLAEDTILQEGCHSSAASMQPTPALITQHSDAKQWRFKQAACALYAE